MRPPRSPRSLTKLTTWFLPRARSGVAEKFGLDYVNTMSDPAREAVDCGATAEFFEHQPAAIDDTAPRLADRLALASPRT